MITRLDWKYPLHRSVNPNRLRNYLGQKRPGSSRLLPDFSDSLIFFWGIPLFKGLLTGKFDNDQAPRSFPVVYSPVIFPPQTRYRPLSPGPARYTFDRFLDREPLCQLRCRLSSFPPWIMVLRCIWNAILWASSVFEKLFDLWIPDEQPSGESSNVITRYLCPASYQKGFLDQHIFDQADGKR